MDAAGADLIFVSSTCLRTSQAVTITPLESRREHSTKLNVQGFQRATLRVSPYKCDIASFKNSMQNWE